MITREDRQPFHDTCRILDKADDFIYVLPHPGCWNGYQIILLHFQTVTSYLMTTP